MTQLFSPIRIGDLDLVNRIVVSPMCQYSAEHGVPTPWHLVHYGMLANSGAGLLVIEATHVEERGRITPGCLGLYTQAQEDAVAGIVRHVRRFGSARLGIQLAHAGRKGSAERPWEGRAWLLQDGWQTIAASAVPFGAGWPAPREASRADMDEIRAAFVRATERALRIGFDEIEVHAAHGYLLHTFLSPIANKRTDRYGGSFENRVRYPLEVLQAVRAHWPAGKPMAVRLSVTDWHENGWTIEDTIRFAALLRTIGVDIVCVSSGGIAADIVVPAKPGYQSQFCGRIRREAGIKTRAVGLITEPQEAERLIAGGDADLVALARGFLYDPRWGAHAAAALGGDVVVPPQYERAFARKPAAVPPAGAQTKGAGG